MKRTFYQLELAEKYLNEGQDEKARQLVLIYIDDVPFEPDLCFRWAKVCESLGMAKQAKKFYQKALRSGQANSEILFNYASLLNDLGYYEDSIHYLRKSLKLDPENKDAKRLLSELYRAGGFSGQADILQKPSEQKKEHVRYFPPTISKEHIDRILSLFSGREIGYAIQQLDRKTADPVYTFQNQPLSPELISRHIKGEITLAVYPIRSDKTAKYGIIEIRPKSRIIKRNLKNTGYLKYLEEKNCNYAIALKKYAQSIDIPSYIDSSDSFSFRLWFFFKEFVHFLKIRRFLKIFIENAPFPESFIEIDLYIGTKAEGIGWIEYPVLLPFGINLSTKRRSFFIDEEGKSYPDQLLFLKKIQEFPFEDSFRKIKISGSKEIQKTETHFSGRIAHMINSCSILNEIINKAKAGRILSQQEKVILFYTIGIADNNGTVLHTILNPCPDYNYTKIERQRIRLKPNPISCVKIRKFLPELTASVSCNCVFDLRGGRYPSPVMYINPYLVPPREEFDISEDIPFREIARKYINLKRQKSEIDVAIRKAIEFFEKYYSLTGKNEVQVEKVILYRKEDNGKIKWEIRPK